MSASPVHGANHEDGLMPKNSCRERNSLLVDAMEDIINDEELVNSDGDTDNEKKNVAAPSALTTPNMTSSSCSWELALASRLASESTTGTPQIPKPKTRFFYGWAFSGIYSYEL